MPEITGLLNLARKAGNLLIGQYEVLKAIKKNKEVLILISSDAGGAIKRKVNKLETINVTWNSEELGKLFGRSKISILGIDNRNLAREIKKRIAKVT